ncbi:MAG: PDGLE domain-containing protein [Candidatus Omnitrophota bacterium]|jgi:cobalt/nickel transport protein
MKLTAKLWIGIAVLIVLSPLGLLLPEHFKAGSAWGEWGAGQMQQLVGYIPKGLAKLSSLWQAPIPDYAFKGWEEKGLPALSFAYIISAAIGILIVVLLVLIIGKVLSRKGD